MNIRNNKRKKESIRKIENAFMDLLQTKDISNITITDICNKANLNRTTFYANYLDIYDLVDKIKDTMIKDFFEVYKEESSSKTHSYDFLKLFSHIKDNQLFYKTYFKLNLDLNDSIESYIDELEVIRFDRSIKDIDYHITFFKAGLNAIIRKWLDNNCDKSPEEIELIIKREYKNVSIESK